MHEKIQQILAEVNGFVVEKEEDLEVYRHKYTVKKGIINQMFTEFRELPGEIKREVGKPLNELKKRANDRLDEFQIALKSQKQSFDKPHDLTLPGDPFQAGGRHPLSIVLNRITSIFEKIGFTVAEGPEIEDDWHNFSALNFPDNHPAGTCRIPSS